MDESGAYPVTACQVCRPSVEPYTTVEDDDWRRLTGYIVHHPGSSAMAERAAARGMTGAPVLVEVSLDPEPLGAEEYAWRVREVHAGSHRLYLHDFYGKSWLAEFAAHVDTLIGELERLKVQEHKRL